LDIRGKKYLDDEENYMLRSFVICTLHHIPKRMRWLGK
jgi:hypothetical protein